MADITKQIALRLPQELLDRVDERAEQRGISRNQWFENMLTWALVNTYTTDEGIQMGKEAQALADRQALDRSATEEARATQAKARR